MRPKRLLGVGLAALVVAAGAAACGPADNSPQYGIDVASYQHPNGAGINWQSVKASARSFVYVKATEGTNYTNPWLNSDMNGAAAAGVYRGAYHFARPSSSMTDAANQARYFVSKIGNPNAVGTLPPVLDLEVTGGQSGATLTAWASTWLSTVRALTGRTPMIYTGRYFWTGVMGNPTSLAAYPLWNASWASSEGSMYGGWKSSAFWQYSGGGVVGGVPSSVDLDRLTSGGAGMLAIWANAVPKSTAPAPPAPAPSLSLSISSSTVHVGQSATLTATFSPAKAGVVVQRQYLAGSTWKTVQSGTTGADGRVKLPTNVQQNAGAVVQFRVVATDGGKQYVSQVVKLTVVR